MATARLRDLEVLRAGLTAWLRQAYPEVSSLVVADLAHASAGWSNETLLVTIGTTGSARGRADRVPRRVVVRLPPLQPSFPGADDPAGQGAVHEAVAAAGVPAPAPVTVVDDERWLGVPFLVMPHVAGHVPGQAPALDPWVTGSSAALQRALYEGFVDTVAAVNRVDWATAGLGTVVRGGAPAGGAPGSLEAELDWWARYVAWSCDGVPLAGLDRALAWCVENRPAPGAPPSLLWGDARLGNLVVGEDRSVRAVLDWELASIGPAELDLGWLLALEWTMDELLGLGVPGFPGREETVARYEAGLGRPATDLVWHEVFALVRSLAVSNHQARAAAAAGARYAMGADERNPLVALVRRRIADAGG